MALERSGSRLGRAALLTLLLLSATTSSIDVVLAQDFGTGGEFVFSDGHVVATDDTYAGDSCDCGMSGCSEGGCGTDVCGCGSECGSDCCCDACTQCAPRGPGFWIGGEYLLWRLDGTYLPPLVTQSPSTPANPNAGRLDDPNTTIISGDEVIGDDWRSGYRVFAGAWLDPCHCWAISGDYFDAGDDDYDFTSTPSSSTIIARPFFNSQLSDDDAQLVSVPNQLDGTVNVSASDDLQGAGLALQKCLYSCGDPCGCGPTTQLGFIGGYRYYQYDSELIITENLTVLPGTTQPLVPGTSIFVQDSFIARNEFHGGELGLQGRRVYRWFWCDGAAKIAIGSNRRVVTVNGQTVNTVPNVGTSSFAGGLLTSEVTNIGRYTDSTTVVIPELRLGVGGILSEHLSVRAGYHLIVWGDVAHAAAHLPPGLAVDPRNLPPVQAGGGPEPVFPGIQGSQLVAHGFDFGVQVTY